jgi:hypothetical protein
MSVILSKVPNETKYLPQPPPTSAHMFPNSSSNSILLEIRFYIEICFFMSMEGREKELYS